MINFPNAKINLGLNVLRKRDDGFHDIETVFYPLNFRDALELLQQTQTNDPVAFSVTGLSVDSSMQDNLCMKAYMLLKKEFPQLPPVKIHLHKTIPMGAGLGGGSADAAFMLKLLNDKFKPGLTPSQLRDHAVQLGSDCPFFIINKPCFATGRGEMLEEIPLDLSAYKILLVNPGIHINTGWAFSQISPRFPAKAVKEIIQQPITTWKAELVNDFETVIFPAHPLLKDIKEELYRHGAIYAAMSGSGSTVFGIFNNPVSPALFPGKNYFIKSLDC
ncbi:MAG TPA: 4-(cytidine 5'-diphospho)-2-C-methyl-D-erythritol kinase [Ferruginibacter sp.]|nr:4-(cytidine 5'-diphospho)-2-C-methyl-D-erythritol kinase [Ferruginibacter sp.]